MSTIESKSMSIKITTAIRVVVFIVSAAVGFGTFLYKVGELERRMEQIEALDLAARLARIEVDVSYIRKAVDKE